MLSIQNEFVIHQVGPFYGKKTDFGVNSPLEYIGRDKKVSYVYLHFDNLLS